MSSTSRAPFVNLYISGQQVNTSQYLQRLEVNKLAGSLWRGTLELFDPDWNFLESFVIGNGINTSIQFTYGWDDNPSNVITGALWGYHPEFSNDGIKLAIEFGSPAMSKVRVQDYVSFGQGKPISDVVIQIAQQNSWYYDVESTVGALDHPYTKRGRNDFSYIKQELAPYAINADGLGGYEVYIEKNKQNQEVLHFHTRFYKGNDVNVYKTYIVYRDMDGEVRSFEPSEQFGAMSFFGAGNVSVVGIDPRSKKIIRGKASNIFGSDRLPIHGTKTQAVVNPDDKSKTNVALSKPFSRQADVDSYAKNRWTEGAQQGYDATLSLLGDPYIPVYSQLEVVIITTNPNAPLHYLSGTYFAKSIVDEITREDFSTTVELVRFSANVGSETINRIKKSLVYTTPQTSIVQKEVYDGP